MPQPRSSLAIALQDYKGPRPGIALTIAAIALVGAIVVGAMHILRLGQSRALIEDAQQTIGTLHRYDAQLEVWRQMAADPNLEFAAQQQLRDSIAGALRQDLEVLRTSLADQEDRRLVDQIYQALSPGSVSDPASAGREAMIRLRGRQDAALLQAVSQSQSAQMIAAVLLGLTVLAAGVLIIPMSWVYVRYKQGVPPGL